jgi:RNA polymerase sigma-70 factor (ECF subfamily)
MPNAAALPVDHLFTEHRSLLWGLCYRMTGSAADADDIVQDTFVRAMERPPRNVNEPLRPWLVKVAMNLARDALRRRRRQEYVGPWLPSPIETEPPSHEPAALEGRYDLIESVSFAFLLALEALTPTQRAVLLLRDVFDYSVKETADALDLSESNVKTTHHRARAAMAKYERRRVIPTSSVRQSTREALFAFLRCLEQHDVAGVEALLAEDVRTIADAGGEFQSALRPILGRDKVTRFYIAITEMPEEMTIATPVLNGLPAVVAERRIVEGRQAPRFSLSVELNDAGKISAIYVVAATRKLTAIK